MIRRGDEIRFGPLRVVVAYTHNHETAEVHVFYGEKGHLGTAWAVPLQLLEELSNE